MEWDSNFNWQKRNSLKGRPPIDLLVINGNCITARYLINKVTIFSAQYIYTISCPITKTVVYVGKTSDCSYRKRCHFNKNGKTLVNKWYKGMSSIGHYPIFTVIDATYGDITLMEQSYILYYRGIGQAKFNLKNKMNYIKSVIEMNFSYFKN